MRKLVFVGLMPTFFSLLMAACSHSSPKVSSATISRITASAPVSAPLSDSDPLVAFLKNREASLPAPRADDPLISRLLAKYSAKCDASDEVNCHLTEADIFPGGDAQKALLFRGEKKLYKLPALAPGVQQVLGGSTFCSAPCSLEKYRNTLNERLQGLLNAFDFSGTSLIVGGAPPNDADSNDLTSLFDQRTGQWMLAKEQAKIDGQTKLMPLPHTPIAKDISPVNLLATYHFTEGTGIGTINSAGNLSDELDPFVSLSLDPHVAVYYTQDFSGHAAPGSLGQLFILSVPAAEVFTPTDCSAPLAPDAQIRDLRECNLGNSFDGEIEFDASFVLPVANVHDVIRTSSGLRRVKNLPGFGG